MNSAFSLSGALLLAGVALAVSAQSFSTHYGTEWDVLDGGGGTAMSVSYTLADSVAQPGVSGDSVSANYRLLPASTRHWMPTPT